MKYIALGVFFLADNWPWFVALASMSVVCRAGVAMITIINIQ